MTSVRKEGTGTPRLFMSAAHKSSGKTIVSLGLAASFRTLGLAVQPFKKGPDFIDPLWLTKSAGRSCRNLDFHTMGNDEIRACFTRHSASADVAIIEGNKGCFDGVATDGHDSAAALARLLAAPVVLVIDTEGMTRGIAPLLVGYRAFEPDLNIAGIILNKVSVRGMSPSFAKPWKHTPTFRCWERSGDRRNSLSGNATSVSFPPTKRPPPKPQLSKSLRSSLPRSTFPPC